MRKSAHLFLICLIAFLIPFSSTASSTSEDGKGKRGGVIVGGQQELYFEIVDDGAKVSFYPCDKDGNMLTVVPTQAEITIVYIATAEQYHQRNVALTEGAFTVIPPRDMKIYMYAISCPFKDETIGVKYRADLGGERPR
jgi:hypothetical protein